LLASGNPASGQTLDQIPVDMIGLAFVIRQSPTDDLRYVGKGRRRQENAMRALLYVVFVTIGGMLCVVVGYLVEPKVSMTVSLTVFLALFFANFVVSWLAVVHVMNGSFKHGHGREAQPDVEPAAEQATARPLMPFAREALRSKALVEDGYH
jgi:hypothetical protein